MHHTGTGAAGKTQMVVILQDDCYGHRYSRPRTSRANLSTIVERPERIHASILGLATAYVHLGGRHAEGPAAPHPKKNHDALPLGAFRIQKTARRLQLKSPAATAIHGAQWMGELINMCDAAESKLAINGKELIRPSASAQTNVTTHMEKGRLHEGDLYLCSGSLGALEGALGGVCEGVDAVFQEPGPKRAFVCIRPPGHHCSADMPSGFCWLNNVHVGIGHAVLTHGLTHAAIIDFDLHHGDGSQSITWAHNSRVASMPKNASMSKKTAIGYFSLHDINSYPCEMGDDEKVRNASLCIENAHGQNIWNVHLQPWKTEAEFWQLYEDKYSVILTKAKNFLRLHSDKLRKAPTHPKPRAAIFLSAGFDASEWESPGMQRHQVNVPTSFYARLTSDVVTMAEEEGLGVDGRVISVLEGGYSDRALMSGVLSHISGLTVATDSTRETNMSNGLGPEMGRRLGKLELNVESSHPVASGMKGLPKCFDPEWWSLQRLEEVETLTNPPAPAAPKKNRSEVRPTYTSATQSFTAKIVTPPKTCRSFSGAGANLQQTVVSRSPSPPPPAVDWATAAYELSKLLVPSDRETKSCKPENLNAEASRARRDRFSSVGLPVSTEAPAAVSNPKRMQLRDRRGKTPQYVSEDEEEQPISRASRRKTIADVSLLNDSAQLPTQQSNLKGVGAPNGHARRRSSIASNASSMNAEKGSDFSLGSVTNAQAKRQPLMVKKSRAAANSRAEATKPKLVKKQPPVPRFPSNPSASSATADTEHQVPPAEPTKAGAKEPLPANEESHSKNLDQLSSGMQKMSIKMNVPAKEEYEARQIKPKNAPRGRPPKSTVVKGASPSKAKVKTIKDPSLPKLLPAKPLPVQQLPPPAIAVDSGQGITVASPPVPPASALPLQPAAPEMLVSISKSISPHSEPSASLYKSSADTQEADPARPPHEGESMVEPSEPAFQTTVAPQQHSPQITLPTTPVVAKGTRQELPVFTSTSPIPFGKPGVNPGTIEQTISQVSEGSFLARQNGSLHLPRQPSEHVLTVGKPADSSPVENNVTMEGDTVPAASIWDVPDTPHPRNP